MAMQLLEPFAVDGLREDFDINPSPENDMSVNKGFTALFQLKPEEGGKFIDMLKFNQLLYLMSKSNVEFTTQAFPNWIDDKGDGLPYAYPKNAIVKYTNGNNYVSLINNNTQVPTGANWKLFDITALDNTVKLTGNQTIAGIKTFSSSPIVPTPTTGTQAANKAYVDSQAGGATFVANDTRVKTALNASGNAPIYACRAWVNFNGTGTVAIRAGGNVSSITDNGTGDYTVNFTTAMLDAKYSYSGSTGQYPCWCYGKTEDTLQTSCRVFTTGTAGLTDSSTVSFQVFR